MSPLSLGLGLRLGSGGGRRLVPPPYAPTATAATSITDTGFTANWDAVSGATSYELYIYSDAGCTTLAPELATNPITGIAGTSQAVTGITIETTRYYQVLAVGSGGKSELSSAITVAMWTVDSVAGLAVRLDAYTQPENIDANSRVISMRCRKTNNQLTAQATETTRPLWNSTLKRIEFVAVNQQKLYKGGFFTAEPFMSATKGMGQAFTLIWVGSQSPVFSLGTDLGAGSTGAFIRSGGSASSGAFGVHPIITQRLVYSIIKPASVNPKRVFDTITTTAPYTLTDNDPDPIIYLNNVKQSVGVSGGTSPTADGNVMNNGLFAVGGWAGLYYNTIMNEMLVYDRAISESDLQLIIGFLMRKWGL